MIKKLQIDASIKDKNSYSSSRKIKTEISDVFDNKNILK